MTDDTDHTPPPRASKACQASRGPHPIGLHVASTTQNWLAAATAFPLFQSEGMQIHPALKQQAAELLHDMAGQDLPRLQTAILHQARARVTAALAGMTLYQNHPYQRNLDPMPLAAQIGTTELRDYGPSSPPDAPLVLAVPSLVNPAHVLDLQENHSFLRTLAEQGLHPFLLDWTSPGQEELTFSLEEYITRRLVPLIRHLHHQHGRKIHLMGYCMGGNLSLAAAQLVQDEDLLHSLTLIATPWDFHADQPVHLPALTRLFIDLEARQTTLASVPLNIMQMFFFTLDPTVSDRKFRKFSTLDPNSTLARDFVALEDWVNSHDPSRPFPQTAPLAPGVAKDCLINWYQKNQPHKKEWCIAGQVIDPAALRLPGRVITPSRDRIVPPASAKALLSSLVEFDHHEIDGGHVSMIAGKAAKDVLWHKIALWLK